MIQPALAWTVASQGRSPWIASSFNFASISIQGAPAYDAGMVSIHQRFVGCVRDTRAETFKAGSPEFRALELYVASRGAGLPVEGVAVRH